MKKINENFNNEFHNIEKNGRLTEEDLKNLKSKLNEKYINEINYEKMKYKKSLEIIQEN